MSFVFTYVCPSFRAGNPLVYISEQMSAETSCSDLSHFLDSDSNVDLSCCTLAVSVNFVFPKSFEKENSYHQLFKHSHLLICFVCRSVLASAGSICL